MKRAFVLIFVVLFGLASMSGPSMAAGISSGAFWTIDNQELCLEPPSLVKKAPTYKPCSKKVNGHAVSCQNLAAILPLLGESNLDQRSAIYAERDNVVVPSSRTDSRFRPPRVS